MAAAEGQVIELPNPLNETRVTKDLAPSALPAAVQRESRTVLLPAFTDTLNVLVTQFDQAPVPSNDGACTVDPFTARLAGRAVVVPLANRTANVAVPEAEAFTVNWTKPFVALGPLQNPLPE